MLDELLPDAHYGRLTEKICTLYTSASRSDWVVCSEGTDKAKWSDDELTPHGAFHIFSL